MIRTIISNLNNSIMKKFLLLCLMTLTMGISGFAQSLSDYIMTTGTDATKWIQVTDTTSLITPGAGDYGVSSVHDIGFAFTFGESSYTQFSVNADGNLRFGPTVTGTSNYTTPFSSSNAGINSPKINMLGCDGFLSDSGHVYHEVIGDAPDRVCVIEFSTSTYSTTRSSYLPLTLRSRVAVSSSGLIRDRKATAGSPAY